MSPHSYQQMLGFIYYIFYYIFYIIGVRGFPLQEYFIPARLALDQACWENSSAAAATAAAAVVVVAATPLGILVKYKKYTKEVASVKWYLQVKKH